MRLSKLKELHMPGLSTSIFYKKYVKYRFEGDQRDYLFQSQMAKFYEIPTILNYLIFSVDLTMISLSSSTSFVWIRRVKETFWWIFNSSGLHLEMLIFFNFSSILYFWQLMKLMLFIFFTWSSNLGFFKSNAWTISSMCLTLFFRSTWIPTKKELNNSVIHNRYHILKGRI